MAIKAATTRPYSDKTHAQEPRGRPRNDQPTFSGATEADPLVSVQILKVRTSVWHALAEAAGERKWHRSVLVREILDQWLEKRAAAKKRKKAA